MSQFKLLRPEEVIARWPELSALLDDAVEQGNGEVITDDLRKLVLGGRMFVFADDHFALTCEFIVYPQKTVLVACFGSGKVENLIRYVEVLEEFAKQGGATSIQTNCRNPAMVRYYKKFLNLDPLYAVLEKTL